MNGGLVGAIEQAVSAVSTFLFGDQKHPNCRSIIATVDPIFLNGAPRYMDIIPPEPYERYQMRKWLSQVPHGGIVDNKAVLIVYNEKAPEQSHLIVEDINL
jgi:hypothetical protein